jgi:hypothetical protein
MVAGQVLDIESSLKRMLCDAHAWNMFRLGQHIAFTAIEELRVHVCGTGNGSKLKHIIPTTHSMIEACKLMLEANAQSESPLLLYSTAAGVSLGYETHLLLHLREVFGPLENFFVVKEESTKTRPTLRLRRDTDEPMLILMVVTLDGISVDKQLGTVNVVTGKFPYQSLKLGCFFNQGCLLTVLENAVCSNTDSLDCAFVCVQVFNAFDRIISKRMSHSV